MAADTRVEIGRRPIPQEPMVRLPYSTSCYASYERVSQYIILNLGMSENFGFVDLEHITFPSVMKIDWVRVYQDPNAINIGCDPPDFPTQAYINECVVYPESEVYAQTFFAPCYSTDILKLVCCPAYCLLHPLKLAPDTNPNLTTWVVCVR
jgi:hypothetical protein